MKFKVGDKVKYKDECIKGCDIHNVFVVEHTNSYDCYYLVSDINDSSKKYLIAEEDLELIDELAVKHNKPTKDELFNMPLGTRIFTDAKGINGEDNAFIFDGKDFDSPHFRIPPTIISDELKIIYNDFPDVSPIVGTHIIKIEVPTDYETVYEEYNIEDLRKLNEELTKKVTELKRKLYEKNSQDVNISKQELDIMNDFFERR